MEDELNQTEHQNPPGGEEPDRLPELEGLLARRDEELAEAGQRIAALEQAAAESETRLAAVSGSLTEAVAGYRALLVEAHPEVLEELITGDSIESIKESLEKARALVSRVKEGLEAEVTLARFPVGTPERSSPDLSALSPREKIQYALGGNK